MNYGGSTTGQLGCDSPDARHLTPGVPVRSTAQLLETTGRYHRTVRGRASFGHVPQCPGRTQYRVGGRSRYRRQVHRRRNRGYRQHCLLHYRCICGLPRFLEVVGTLCLLVGPSGAIAIGEMPGVDVGGDFVAHEFVFGDGKGDDTVRVGGWVIGVVKTVRADFAESAVDEVGCCPW